MRTLPKIWNYSDRNTESYAVDVGDTTYFFSYTTCVAFRNKNGLHISKNVWSYTTGRHLNEIHSDKSIRLDYDVFADRLEAWLGR